MNTTPPHLTEDKNTTTNTPATFTIDELKSIRTTISQATPLLRHEHSLKTDGSNFASWEHHISILLNNFIEDASYLHWTSASSPVADCICHAIIILSLPESIQADIINIPSAINIYQHLRRWFFSLLCSAQSLSWREQLSIKMQPEEHPSSFLHQLSNSISAFKNRGGNFTEDLVTGLILQEAVTPASLRSAVLSRLEASMTANQTNPSFPICAMVLESCYQQAKATSHDNITTALQPSFNSLRLDKTTMGDSFSHSSIDPVFF
ncbi:hypothetical protein O181_089355 [Austropuccinia psidii MF-1]|uniref:Uncharacterized protein n=1 Tax=Austropuccinia psidii MF-1 TaxID=1389203 RepID=A0A9Q3ITN1_9BASI|nr:hypothetical protein [Austropuccinia psidii MF-1]